MNCYPIGQLLEKIMPYQIIILERLLLEFSSNKKGIQQIFVRGSISNGRFDRSSDTDVAIVVADQYFEDYLRLLDDLMVTLFGAVMPGWPDKIVPDFGGTGLVYLVRSADGQIFQVDIYVSPQSTANFSTIRAGEITRLYPYPDDAPIPCAKSDWRKKQLVAEQVEQFWAEKDTAETDFVAVCVHAVMILKRIQRSTHWLNMSNSTGLLESIRQLLRRKYCPNLSAYGWYKFDGIVVDERSKGYALALRDLSYKLLPEATFATVEEAFLLSVDIMSTCFPADYENVRHASDFVLETIRRYSLALN